MSVFDKIWVPKKARPKWKCNVPGCDAEFHEDERRARERHVADCAARHAGELLEAYHRKRPPEFYDPFDPELDAYVRKHGHF
jgi:hypothetical protein